MKRRNEDIFIRAQIILEFRVNTWGEEINKKRLQIWGVLARMSSKNQKVWDFWLQTRSILPGFDKGKINCEKQSKRMERITRKRRFEGRRIGELGKQLWRPFNLKRKGKGKRREERISERIYKVISYGGIFGIKKIRHVALFVSTNFVQNETSEKGKSTAIMYSLLHSIAWTFITGCNESLFAGSGLAADVCTV